MLDIYHEAQRKNPRIVCGVEEEYGDKHEKEGQDAPIR